MNTLTEHIAVRVSKDDKQTIDSFCHSHHLDRSGLIRSLIQSLEVEHISHYQGKGKKKSGLLMQH